MKKNFKIIMMVAMVVAAGFTTFNAQVEELQISSLAMENIEAIAGGEVSIPYLCAGDAWACYDDYYNEWFQGRKL